MRLFSSRWQFRIPVLCCLHQTDVLNEGRIADAASYLQDTARAPALSTIYRYILCSGDFLIDVVGIDIPCIEQTRNIFI